MNGTSVTQEGLVTIKEYLEKQIAGVEKVLLTEINNSDRALNLAKAELERRMEGFPEIFMKKDDVKAELLEIRSMVRELSIEITSLQEAKAELRGKASQQGLLMVLAVAITSFVIGGIGLVMRALKF